MVLPYLKGLIVIKEILILFLYIYSGIQSVFWLLYWYQVLLLFLGVVFYRERLVSSYYLWMLPLFRCQIARYCNLYYIRR